MITRPTRLRAGDTVAVVSPSGPVDPVLLERGIGRLAGLGLKVVTGGQALARSGFLAGSDEVRAADLQAAWCDPAVAAVFCARGGYGAGRLLGLLDWAAMRAAGPKTLVGSSDITALHVAFADELEVATLHGPMPACASIAAEDGPEPITWRHLRAALFADQLPVPADRVLLPGRAEGPLTGGNLSLLASLCGTPHQPAFSGKIVLLEEIGEEPYRVDRMLTQLLRSGAFAGVRGIVLGSWVRCGEVLPVLAERLLPLGVPTLAGLAVGHGSPQMSVWLGAVGVIDTESCSRTGTFRPGDRAS